MSPSETISAMASISRASFDKEEDRLNALQEARALCRRLETPWDTLAREIWLSPSASTAIKIAQDCGLLSRLSLDGPGKTVQALSSEAGCAPDLTQRLLRVLLSIDMVQQGDDGMVKATELSQAFTQPGYVGGMTHLFSMIMPTLSKLPEYLRGTGFTTPQDPDNGPWQFASATNEPLFNWMMKHPLEAEGFSNLMALYHEQSVSNWVDTYPTSQFFEGQASDSDMAETVIVDVGGGVGRDMQNLAQAVLPLKPKLIVQDLPMVAQQARLLSLPANIEITEHDFFGDQPVTGARAYFMHHILHDWPDHLALKILAKIRAAMKKGYSKLLLCELVMPERNLPQRGAIDLVMMALLSSKERTEGDWRALLDAAGFSTRKIWGSEEIGQCVIEAEI